MRSGESPNYNFTRQETSDNPRFNNLVRVDVRPSGNNTIWATVRTFSSSQYGSEITAGPAKWGFFDGSYVSGDNGVNGGWNHVAVLERRQRVPGRHSARDRRVRHQDDSRPDRILQVDRRLHPAAVPSGAEHARRHPARSRSASATTGIDQPGLHLRQPPGIDRATTGWRACATTDLDARHAHRSRSAGTSSTCRTTRRAAATGWANSRSTTTPTTRSTRTSPSRTPCSASTQQYTETDRYRRDPEPAMVVRVVRPGHLAARRSRLTFDYGVRFLLYSPY